MELDRYDRAILRLLQQDARITNTLLAGKVSLSESACLRRVRARDESSGQVALESRGALGASRARRQAGLARSRVARGCRCLRRGCTTHAAAPRRVPDSRTSRSTAVAGCRDTRPPGATPRTSRAARAACGAPPRPAAPDAGPAASARSP